MAEPEPTVVVLGGCNGAGKTTASRRLLADRLGVLTFVNADVIAQGLSGFDPDAAAIAASRIMLAQLHELADRRADFAFETTLAGRTTAPWLQRLRESGYQVHLYYFWLSSADLAVARVAHRVRLGGHTIPEATIRRRYVTSLQNYFQLYRPVVSTWHVYDNSVTEQPGLIAAGGLDQPERVSDEQVWARLQKEGAA
jgi:predicted ABC-type ATPase